jgi:hypothetical protein
MFLRYLNRTLREGELLTKGVSTSGIPGAFGMLTISQKQLDLLNDVADDRFEARLTRLMKTALPDTVAKLATADAGNGLLAMIRSARERAAAHDITEDADVAVFTAFLIADSDFDAVRKTRFREWVVPSLLRETSPGQVRLALAEHILRRKASGDAFAAFLCAIVDTVRKSF